MENNTTNAAKTIWGPYPNYDDIARLEYWQRMWRHDDMRRRLLGTSKMSAIPTANALPNTASKWNWPSIPTTPTKP